MERTKIYMTKRALNDDGQSLNPRGQPHTLISAAVMKGAKCLNPNLSFLTKGVEIMYDEKSPT